MRRGWEERWEGKEKGESRRIVKSIGLKNKLKERGDEAWRDEKREEEEERWNWEWTEERRQEKARDKKIHLKLLIQSVASWLDSPRGKFRLFYSEARAWDTASGCEGREGELPPGEGVAQRGLGPRAPPAVSRGAARRLSPTRSKDTLPRSFARVIRKESCSRSLRPRRTEHLNIHLQPRCTKHSGTKMWKQESQICWLSKNHSQASGWLNHALNNLHNSLRIIVQIVLI